MEACETCGDGFYSEAGSGYCSPCAAGTFTSPDQASCDVCTAGKISGIAAQECTDCESGKFNNLVGQETCAICDINQGTNSSEGRTFCECNVGFAGITVREELLCIKCPEGGVCDDSGTTLKNLPIKPMKWRTSPKSDFLEDCIFTDACIGNIGNETESVCAVGYEGPLCAVCSNSAKGTGQLTTCEKCDGDATATIAVASLYSLFCL